MSLYINSTLHLQLHSLLAVYSKEDLKCMNHSHANVNGQHQKQIMLIHITNGECISFLSACSLHSLKTVAKIGIFFLTIRNEVKEL